MSTLLLLLSVATLGARTAPRPAVTTHAARNSHVCRVRDTTLADDRMAGTFRFVISSNRVTLDDGLLVLERAGELTLGTLMLSGSPPSALARIMVRDTALTADVLTTNGPARLDLRIAGDTLRGEIVRGTSHFTIAGVRTS